MTTRREIKSRHEAAVIGAAVRAHNSITGGMFKIESNPEPPDAILSDGCRRLWLEHTDAFYPGWAEDLTSYAASDKEHRPMRRGPHIDMDNIFADVFLEVVLNKLKNVSYMPLIEQFGPGILVVGLESPWLDSDTIRSMNRKWIEHGSPDMSSVFKWVYLGYREHGKNVAIPWEFGRGIRRPLDSDTAR